MIEQDDVLYMDGKLFVVRMVAVNSYILREILTHGGLGEHINVRKGAVEFNPTLSFVGIWDEAAQHINWDKHIRTVELPPTPKNVIVGKFRDTVKEDRKANNNRILREYDIKGTDND